jgi:hypothetical protein
MNASSEKDRNKYLKMYSMSLASLFNYIISSFTNSGIEEIIDAVIGMINDGVTLGYVISGEEYKGQVLIDDELESRIKNTIMPSVKKATDKSTVGWEMIFDYFVGVKK